MCAAIGGVLKPKSHKGKRFLEEREAKVIENTKTTIFVRGGNTSDVVKQFMKDLFSLKKPDAVMYQRKNPQRPFEDAGTLEYFSHKADASLFLLGSHSKKRPHNVVFGRTYNHRVLDMFELGIQNFKPLSFFKNQKCIAGSKPCLVFNGATFETEDTYARLKSTFIDFFRGPEVEGVRLSGLDHVISLTATDDGKLHFRSFKILLKKSGVKTPRIELEEMGPSFDLVLRRHQTAPPALYKTACRTPKALKSTKKKNISYDNFGTKLGNIHMERQDFAKLQTRKRKALKKVSNDTGVPPVSKKKKD